MSTIHPSKGVVLATAVAAIFSAGCTGKGPQNQAEAKSPEEQPFEALEWSIQPVDEDGEQAGGEDQPGAQGQQMPGMIPGADQPGAQGQQMPGMIPGADQPTEVKVACFGINACKGQSDCATPRNACKGMNSCKGQGFKYVSMKECEAQGGKVGKPSM